MVTQEQLFGIEQSISVVKAVKTPKKRKAKEFYEQHSEEELKNMIKEEKERLEELEKQDETGWSEFDISIKGKEVNGGLVKNHIQYYETALDRKQGGNKWKIHKCVNCDKEYEEFKEKDVRNFVYNTCKECCAIEERKKYIYLDNWRDFLINLCKERGQEIDKIWLDTSVPYDCEVEIRLKGHRCWNSCVSFRFQDGKLRAYDSGFGGGTSFVSFGASDISATEEEKIIREVMEQVFNKECDTDYVHFWDKDDYSKPITHREINIDEKGWIIK